jgi:hypothetical protein
VGTSAGSGRALKHSDIAIISAAFTVLRPPAAR